MGHMDAETNTNIRVDFHSHILPDMDDGAADSGVSVSMLMCLQRQNASLVCLTPHYSYHRESIDHFLARREQSYEKLTEALRRHGLENCVPQIRLGAEVRAEADLADEPKLCKLCCTGTDMLLLELPFTSLENRIYEAIENIALKYRIIPVIAHFERYRQLYSRDERERILSLPNVIIQVNAEALKNLSERKFVFSLISEGVPVILGSDAHDMERRPPRLEKAYRKIDTKLKDCERAAFYHTARNIFSRNDCITF